MSDEEKKASGEPETSDAKEGREPETGSDQEVDILKEVSLLGQNFGAALLDVWNSDERKKIEREFVKGVHTANKEMRSFAEEVRTGKATQGFVEGAERVGKDMRSGLLAGLRLINKELGKVRRPRDEEPEKDGE
jgi:hypothetical protein